MAQLALTELETHPTGTGGLNAVINGNWSRIEELFDPALSNTDSAFHAFSKALLRDAMASMVNGETITYTSAGWKRRAPIAALTYAASTAITFESGQGAPVKTLALTGNVTFTTSNLAAGQEMRVAVTADGSLRTLAFPGTWKWLGSAPVNIAASKTGVLTLISTTTADSGVIAKWEVEP